MEENKKIDIIKYSGFFHDGDIKNITQARNKIELWMESAEVLPEWNEDNITLSQRNRITGKLHLDNIIKLTEDGKIIKLLKIKNGWDKANVVGFKASSNVARLIIYWVKFAPAYLESREVSLEIQAEKIYWENIPTLFDAYWDSLEK